MPTRKSPASVRLEDLTHRRQAFVLAFTGKTHGGKGFLNPVKSFDLAGYAEDPKGANAYHVVADPRVKAVIQRRLGHLLMSDDEAAMIHAAQARGSFRPFIDIVETEYGAHAEVNLATEKALQNLHLIKRIRQRKTFKQSRDGTTTTMIEHDIELYDAQLAAKLIRSGHGAYNHHDRSDGSHYVSDPDQEIHNKLIALLDKKRLQHAQEDEDATIISETTLTPNQYPQEVHNGQSIEVDGQSIELDEQAVEVEHP